MPVTSARRMHPQILKRHRGGAPQTPTWNWVAMGQMGLTGWTREAAKPLARAIARRTGRPEAQILALIGAGFLAISLIDFLRQVDAVIAAGRTAQSVSQGRTAAHIQNGPRGAVIHLRAGPPLDRRASNPGDSSHSKDDDIAKTMARRKP
jgi:hypothetical protein